MQFEIEGFEEKLTEKVFRGNLPDKMLYDFKQIFGIKHFLGQHEFEGIEFLLSSIPCNKFQKKNYHITITNQNRILEIGVTPETNMKRII